MKKIFKLSLLFIIVLSLNVSAQKVVQVNAYSDKIISNTVIFKLQAKFRNSVSNNNIDNTLVNNYLQSIGVEAINQKFPYSDVPKEEFDKYGHKLTDISLIYEFTYKQNISVAKVINYLSGNEIFEYVEPHFVQEVMFSPNDSLLYDQYYLNKMQVFDAWEINKGDTNIVIGITDTGTDIDHPDLIHQFKYNYADPLDGIDNDNDGYIDNFRGWDMGMNDNNPQCGGTNDDASIYTVNHGAFVCGYAAAETNNGIGLASTGYNSKILPVKISDNNFELTMSYEGLVYAADHGCDIINCSWGGGSGSRFGQDIINYVTFNQNALVLASAGNSSSTELFYPASYDYVLSIGQTGSDDVLSGSNYGIKLDVSAPSVHTLAVNDGGGYTQLWSGTSFSCPMTAGCAAIVKAQYPNYTALQIGEILKVTADNIDTVAGNAGKEELLGAGRVNLYNALTNTLPPSITFENAEITDNNDNIFIAGETIEIHGLFRNYLSDAENLNISISATTPNYVQIISATNSIGRMHSMDSFDNSDNPFTFKLLPGIPYDEMLVFKLTFVDGTYHAIQYVYFMVNKSFTDIDTNNITTTITANGTLGFSSPGIYFGSGFSYKNYESMIYDGGLLLGTSANSISTAFRQYVDFDVITPAQVRVNQDTSDLEFKSDFDIINKSEAEDNRIADMLIHSSFNDSLSETIIGVKINHTAMAWNTEGHKNYVIMEYDIINQNNSDITGLYAGLCADWDILNASENKIDFDASKKLSYTYSSGNQSIYAGMQLLSSQAVNHYAIEQVEGGDGLVDITDGFSNQEKFYVISNSRNQAGVEGNGNDVVDAISAGPFDIAARDTVKVAFALLSGDNIYSLRNSADSAISKYNSIYNQENTISEISNNNFNIDIYPNPIYGTNLSIEIKTLTQKECSISILNILGEKVHEIQVKTNSKVNVNVEDLEKGTYFINAKYGNQSVVKKFIIL